MMVQRIYHLRYPSCLRLLSSARTSRHDIQQLCAPGWFAMQIIVVTIIRSLPMMGDVMVLGAFYLAVFSVTTIQLFMGQLDKRCGAPDFSNAWQEVGPDNVTYLHNITYVVPEEFATSVCKSPLASSIVWSNDTGVPTASNVTTTKLTSNCPTEPTDDYPHGLFCTPHVNPSIGGFRNFDNFPMAGLAIFQHITMTDWSFIMYDTQVCFG